MGLLHINRPRSGFCAADHTDISEMVDDAEDKLFRKILNDVSHVLSRAVEVGFKKPRFLGFKKKPLKTANPTVGFLGFYIYRVI